MDPKLIAAARAAFPASPNALVLGAPLHAGECHPEPLVRVGLDMLNRHGLVAGATGTGKTKTLQVLAGQLSDARVPVSAGERFADLLGREWPHLRDRTIFLTADVRPDTEAWLRGLGCPFFFKPFRVAELKAAIARVLDAGPATSGRASGAAEHRLEAG